MVSIIPTSNTDILEKIYSDSNIYPFIRDDGCPKEFVGFALNPTTIYLLILVDEYPAGVIAFSRKNFITYEVHVSVLKEYRGIGFKASVLALDWIKKNTKIKKLVSETPSDLQNAIKIVKKLGFHSEGVSKRSFKRDGMIYDLIKYGLEV